MIAPIQNMSLTTNANKAKTVEIYSENRELRIAA